VKLLESFFDISSNWRVVFGMQGSAKWPQGTALKQQTIFNDWRHFSVTAFLVRTTSHRRKPCADKSLPPFGAKPWFRFILPSKISP